MLLQGLHIQHAKDIAYIMQTRKTRTTSF